MNIKNHIITECAISIALSCILSTIPIFKMLNGGSITFASTAPISILSFRQNYKWGLLSGFIYSVFQLIYSFHFPPSKTIYSFLLSILLDYVISYTSIGLCCTTKYIFKNKYLNITCGLMLVFIIRLMCSTVSGILVWQDYAPTNVHLWLYSLIYNMSYLLPEYIFTVIICLSFSKYIYKENVY